MDDEFGMLRENAEEVGLPWSGPPEVRRIADGALSALRWGERPPRLVLLHGGAQNAHTWDTVLLALGVSAPEVPALAVDLPGHGHSAWRSDHDYSPRTNAAAVAPFLRAHAPDADAVIGMSLGGLTTIALTTIAPDLVRRAVIVDVTPAAGSRVAEMTTAQQGTVALARSGPAEFDTREEMIEAAVAAAPHRSPSSLRRGVVHNTRRTAGGRWAWRYDRPAGSAPDFGALWADLSSTAIPLTLVRGGDSAFVTDADAEEFERRTGRHPGTRVHVVPGAGHAVQSDRPLELAAIIRAVTGLG